MPTVSVIIPCYNEQATIRSLLEALRTQTYPCSEIEAIVVDGQSTDHTRQEILAFQQQHPELAVRLLDNPVRAIPAALNLGLRAAAGQYLIRLDAHSQPYPDYIERCVSDLEQGLGDNVGGVWEIRPGSKSWLARSIAAAAAHPLGVGDALYRHTSRAQAADTVPFFAFRRALLERIGSYDETLLTNEDYEFNVRVRQSGSVVWLDPKIRSIYFARATLGGLAQQYWRYGFWKARMIRRYPGTIRWRQAIPPIFVLSLLVLLALTPWLSPARWALALEIGLYGLILLAVGAREALRKKDPALILGLPLSIAVMHLTWGSAFLWSLIQK